MHSVEIRGTLVLGKKMLWLLFLEIIWIKILAEASVTQSKKKS